MYDSINVANNKMGHLSLPSSSSSWMSEISTESSPPYTYNNEYRPRPKSLESEDAKTGAKNFKNPAQSSIHGTSTTTCRGIENLNLATWSSQDSSCPPIPAQNDKSDNFFDAHNGYRHPAVHIPAQNNFVPTYREHSGSGPADPSNMIASNALHKVDISHKYDSTKMQDDGRWPQVKSFNSSGQIASALTSVTPPQFTEINLHSNDEYSNNTTNKPKTVSLKVSGASDFCNLCKTAYKKCKNRFRHRIIQSNKCILQCSQCPRRFRHPSLLIGHKLVHKSERMRANKSTFKQQTPNSTSSLSSTVKPVLLDSLDFRSASEPNVTKVLERSSSSSQEEIQQEKEPTTNSRRSNSRVLLSNKVEKNPNPVRSFMEEDGIWVRIGKQRNKYPCPKITRCNMELEEIKILNEQAAKLHSSATRDKPYVCSACGRGLQWSRNLKRHYKLTHPEIPFGPTGFFYRANTSIQTREGQGGEDNDDSADDMYSHQSVVKAARSSVTPSIRGPRGETTHKRSPKKLPNTIQQRLNIHILEYNCLICHELFSYRVDAVNHALLH